MSKTRQCTRCEASDRAGTPNVFCPACALQQALGGGAHESDLEEISETQSQAMNRAAPVPNPGEIIEDYEILEKIGGNMGLVFKARHRRLGKLVALKLLPAETTSDPERAGRFQREIRILGQLEHPNIVGAADARVVGAWHFVAMEWIEGLDLHRWVKSRGPLPIAMACEVAREAALGLQYAHEHGLIHRDIKPSNLMVTSHGTVKVIDMGLGLMRDDDPGQLTQPGYMMGTVGYCAPEQFRDASTVDIRADVYSLGCTLYHLIAGKPPFAHRESLPEIMQAHFDEPLPRLVEMRPDVPPGLDALIARMTAKNPAERFATPGAVAAALAPFAKGANLKEYAPTQAYPGPREARPTPNSPAAPRPKATSEPRRPSPKGVWFGIAAVVLALAAVAAGLLLNKQRGQANTVARPSDGSRVVVLLDTTARGGIYDPDNYDTGRCNADELYERLAASDGLLSPSELHKEGIGTDWSRDSFVIGLHPEVVIIHRSSFFHPLSAKLKLGSPPFANKEDHSRWQGIYDSADLRLRNFITLVGTAVPNTQFLIYSRGTDTNWLSQEFRSHWATAIESSFPSLKGRITTMVIPNGKLGTFRDPPTLDRLRSHLRDMLKKVGEGESGKRN